MVCRCPRRVVHAVRDRAFLPGPVDWWEVNGSLLVLPLSPLEMLRFGHTLLVFWLNCLKETECFCRGHDGGTARQRTEEQAAFWKAEHVARFVSPTETTEEHVGQRGAARDERRREDGRGQGGEQK